MSDRVARSAPRPRGGSEGRHRNGKVRVRPYRDEDRDGVYDVCVRTARPAPDNQLVGDIFAGPYLFLEPDLAFVADNGERPVGYIVGTADTPTFVEAYRQRWLPRVQERYQRPLGPASSTANPDDELLLALFEPERMLVAELAPYPAHLHINLLPAYQGAGYGRTLMAIFLSAASAKGSPSAHLGSYTSNTGARAFYDKLGFQPIEVRNPGPLTFLWRATDLQADPDLG